MFTCMCKHNKYGVRRHKIPEPKIIYFSLWKAKILFAKRNLAEFWIE